MPPPRELRAGAIWVEVLNWSRACQRRYGGAHVVTGDGSMSVSDVVEATRLHGSPGRAVGRVRATAGVLAKDVRTAWRAGVNSRNELPSPPDAGRWVWQCHGLFRRSGFGLAERLGVPCIQFVDAPIVWEAQQWGVARPGWGRLLERVGELPQLRRADLVLCVSDEVAHQVRSLGVNDDRILVTPCTADPAAFDDVADERPGLGLGTGPVVGWVGSFRPFHRLDVLIDAMAEVSRAVPDAKLLLVGDGPERERVVRRATELGVQVVAPGSVTHDRIPAFVMSMDVAVLPADSGQEFHYSPLKLKEFLAAGRATVAPRVGEIERMLTSGIEALLYEPGCVTELAGNIRQLLDDSGLREQVGTAGRELCDLRFSIDRQLEEVDQRLEALGAGS